MGRVRSNERLYSLKTRQIFSALSASLLGLSMGSAALAAGDSGVANKTSIDASERLTPTQL